MFKAPEFWNHTNGLSTILRPLSGVFRFAGWMRAMLASPYEANIPVICVGNITSGGTGKTPLCAYLYQELKELGFQPVILSRGYGGTLKGPVACDPSLHNAADIGDEALMLSYAHNVCVARDRAEGAAFIQRTTDATVILMDDGMQNPWLKKDMLIAVFDGAIGVQNGFLLPAGPLRQTLTSVSQHLDLVIINGADKTGLTASLINICDVLAGSLKTDQAVFDNLSSRRFIGFAGIGRPKRFFDMLDETEAEIVKTVAFADHHPFSEADLNWLNMEAQQLGAELITTMKDWIRLPSEWRDRVEVLPVFMQFSAQDADRLRQNIMQKLALDKM